MRALPLLLLAACGDSSLFVFEDEGRAPGGVDPRPSEQGEEEDEDLTVSVDDVDADAPQSVVDQDGLWESWTEEDGWLVSPAITPDGGGTVVGVMLDAIEESPDASIALMAQGIAENGLEGAWVEGELTWSEGRFHVIRGDLGALYIGARLRVSVEEATLLDGLSWSLHVPVSELDEGASSAREVAEDDGARALGSTWTALGVISRASWGARAASCSTAESSKWRMAIHHTASLPTSGGSVAERVRQIQAYSMDTRGFCDIPYHFLLGIDGSVYEGRVIDTLGGHTSGNNSGNAGLSAVGCFHASDCPDGGSSPPDAMLYSLSRMVAALSSEYGISVDADHVKGHRDHSGASTACPGEHLYARLGDVRSAASNTGTVTTGSTSEFLGIFVGVASTASGAGYWMVSDLGEVVALGDAEHHGDASALDLAAPVVGVAATPSGEGYWLVAEDGGVFTYGDAGFYGSAGSLSLAAPMVGLAPTPSGDGYWLVGGDGGVFSYGDAGFYGSAGATSLAAPVVGMAATPSGAGYWLVAEDGGIFSYGDADFHGSMGGETLSQPVSGMGALPGGDGYWLVAEDGGIFSFGSTGFYGSMGGTTLSAPVRGMAVTPTGEGYWMVGEDGGIFSFGDAGYYGNGL